MDQTTPHPTPRKCTATNRQGNPCRNYPAPGATVCRNHGGKAPRVKAAAERRVALESVKRTLIDMGETSDELTDPAGTLRRLGARLVQWVETLEQRIDPERLTTVDAQGVVRLRPEAELLRGYMQDLAKIAGTLAKLPIQERAVEAVELSASAEWVQARTALLEVLAEHPEAYAAVVDRLRAMELDQ